MFIKSTIEILSQKQLKPSKKGYILEKMNYLYFNNLDKFQTTLETYLM
jgi:hypothetical protein